MFAVSDEPTVVPGPFFESSLGPPCQAIAIDELRRSLDEAGWKFILMTSANHELWTAN
jgi:hypothetical protein